MATHEHRHFSRNEIEQLTSLDDIHRALEQLNVAERRIDEDLADFIAPQNQESLDSKLDFLDLFPTKIKSVRAESQSLAATIAETCALAENVSRKVRELDLAKERVKQTERMVADIIDVKNCVQGVKQAMQSQDYEQAASHVKRFLQLDERVLDESSTQALREWADKLLDVVRIEFDGAVKKKDMEGILRFARLFAPVGHVEEGVKRYSQYVRRLLSVDANGLYSKLWREHQKRVDAKQVAQAMACVDATGELFEGVAHYLEEHCAIVRETFGDAESVILFIREIQKECDIHSIKVLDLFTEEAQMSRIFNLVRGSVSASNVDPREVGELLDMLVLISHRCELYDQYVRRKSKTYFEEVQATKKEQGETQTTGNTVTTSPRASGTVNTAGVSGKQDGMFHVSELNRRIQETMGRYIALEQYFMVESVKLAVSMDEERSEDGLTTQMVDYVFFLIQKSMERAVSSHSVDSLCAIANLVNHTLNFDFKDVLQQMLREKASESVHAKTVHEKTSYLIVLNNLELTAEYLVKLKIEMETECEVVFGQREKDWPKIKACLSELVETSKSFKEVLQGNLEQVASTIKPRIRPLVDLFASANFELNDLQFAENNVNDPFLQPFIQGVEDLCRPFQKKLSESNFDGLLHIIIRHITKRLESCVLQQRFTQLGSLQVDKDVRGMITYFSEKTRRTVRGEFARLTQMVSLLNLEKVEEVLDYWGANSGAHMTWRLTPGEVRKILSRRVEFRPEAIANLRL